MNDDDEWWWWWMINLKMTVEHEWLISDDFSGCHNRLSEFCICVYFVLSPPPPHRHRWADSVRILGSAGYRKLQLFLFAFRAELPERISALGLEASNSRTNFPFSRLSVFGMQELIAQSSPDRRLDNTAQPFLHGVKPTGQWAKHVCLENSENVGKLRKIITIHGSLWNRSWSRQKIGEIFEEPNGGLSVWSW